jgi:hypothetical protein
MRWGSEARRTRMGEEKAMKELRDGEEKRQMR